MAESSVGPPASVTGIELNGAFYREVVAPLLVPWDHAAALLGPGSDVLGYDDARSTDHGWGPRLVVFVDAARVEAARAALDGDLPETFRGLAVRYGWDDVPVQHHVGVYALSDWLAARLGVNASRGLSTTDWLLVPQQKLLEVTAGAVYHDGVGELGRARQALSWYPHDVWLWMLAAQWRRIAQEEAFVGRAAEVGDEIGWRLVAARVARELMRLAFLYERTYWPYSKWFGVAFARLRGVEPLRDALQRVVGASDAAAGQRALADALEIVAHRHNASALTGPVDPSTRSYYSRPFTVLMADRFTDACLAAVGDPALRRFALIGAVDQWADSTDLLMDATRTASAEAIYGARGLRAAPAR